MPPLRRASLARAARSWENRTDEISGVEEIWSFFARQRLR
jgi:hypothetical protein